MLNFFKTILLALTAFALALFIEQVLAFAENIFWQKEVVFNYYTQLTGYLASTAAIEEMLKYVALVFVMRKLWQLRGIGFILLSILLGFLWGIFETGLVLYTNQNLISDITREGQDIIFSFSALTAIHTLTAFLMATLVATQTFSGRLKHIKTIFFPLLVHLLFNFLIIQKGDFTNYLIEIALAIPFFACLLVLLFNRKTLD